jgi:hypothetical protein
MAGKTSDLIRFLTTRLRGFVSERRLPRREARFKARLPFIITLLGSEKASVKKLRDAPSLVGYTRDLSKRGLTLLLPSVRLGDVYLTAGESYLGVKLQLPDGQVALLTVSVRFEQLSQKEAECSYLLAVRIVKMQKAERERYFAYLSTIKSRSRRRRERREIQTASVLAGSNSTVQSGRGETLTPASVSQAFEQFLRKKT